VDGTWRKSSYSNSFSNCLEAAFRKSSHSAGGNCTEAAITGGRVLVRDSKLGEASPVLAFTPEAWQAFLDGVRA
jgi:hypothetical protein